MKSLFVWFAALLLSPAFASAMQSEVQFSETVLLLDGGVVCGKMPMPTIGVLSYCLQPGSKERVLLSFPGVWNTEYAYQKKTPQELASNLRALGNPPSIFTMTIGRISFLTGQVTSSGKTDVQEVVDAVVKTLVKHGFANPLAKPGYIDLLGESMGGHNSIMMYLRAPKLFRKFALICPALSRLSPFISEVDWFASMDRDAEWYRSLSYKRAMMFFFGSDETWSIASPLHYARSRYVPLAQPSPVFVGSVRNDYFGFNSGGREFVKILKAKGHNVETDESIDPNHCDVRTLALARFLNR